MDLHEKLSKKRIPQIIGVVLFIVFNTVAIVCGNIGHLRLAAFLFGGSLIYPISFFVLARGFRTLAKTLISTSVPIIVICSSIIYKEAALGLGSLVSVDYYITRIILISTITIPVSIFCVHQERFYFILNLLPSFVIITLYDPIYDFFGVGYDKLGMGTENYLIPTNLLMISSYLFFTLSQAFLRLKFDSIQILQSKKNNRLREFFEQLTHISNSENPTYGNLRSFFEEICVTAQKTLNIDRVSIWEFTENYDGMFCHVLWNKDMIEYPDSSFLAQDYPNYFQTITNTSFMAISDVMNSQELAEFRDVYFKPLNVRSVLDAGYKVDGTIRGVICCEKHHTNRKWQVEDFIAIQTLGDFISHAIATRQRMEQNQQLERLYKERSNQLDRSQKQISEYAYINSHVLRAPVARISGLLHLSHRVGQQEFDEEIRDRLFDSIKELEAVTQKINLALDLKTNPDSKEGALAKQKSRVAVKV